MTRSTPRPDDRYSGEETRENKSLEHLVDPVDPVVFDPDPSGSDMPEPSSSGSSGTGEGGSDQPAETAD